MTLWCYDITFKYTMNITVPCKTTYVTNPSKTLFVLVIPLLREQDKSLIQTFWVTFNLLTRSSSLGKSIKSSMFTSSGMSSSWSKQVIIHTLNNIRTLNHLVQTLKPCSYCTVFHYHDAFQCPQWVQYITKVANILTKCYFLYLNYYLEWKFLCKVLCPAKLFSWQKSLNFKPQIIFVNRTSDKHFMELRCLAMQWGAWHSLKHHMFWRHFLRQYCECVCANYFFFHVSKSLHVEEMGHNMWKNEFYVVRATTHFWFSLHTLRANVCTFGTGAESQQCSHITVTVAYSVWTNSHCAGWVKAQSHHSSTPTL